MWYLSRIFSFSRWRYTFWELGWQHVHENYLVSCEGSEMNRWWKNPTFRSLRSDRLQKKGKTIDNNNDNNKDQRCWLPNEYKIYYCFNRIGRRLKKKSKMKTWKCIFIYFIIFLLTMLRCLIQILNVILIF